MFLLWVIFDLDIFRFLNKLRRFNFSSYHCTSSHLRIVVVIAAHLHLLFLLLLLLLISKSLLLLFLFILWPPCVCCNIAILSSFSSALSSFDCFFCSCCSLIGLLSLLFLIFWGLRGFVIDDVYVRVLVPSAPPPLCSWFKDYAPTSSLFFIRRVCVCGFSSGEECALHI